METELRQLNHWMKFAVAWNFERANKVINIAALRPMLPLSLPRFEGWDGIIVLGTELLRFLLGTKL